MTDIATRLAGYKTYLTAVIAVLAVVASVVAHTMTPTAAGVAILGTLMAVFVRSGSKADAVRSSALVLSQLLPIVVKVLPANMAAPVAEVADIAAGVAAEDAPTAALVDATPVVVPDAARPAPLDAPSITIPPVVVPAPAPAIDPAAIEAVVASYIARLFSASKAI